MSGENFASATVLEGRGDVLGVQYGDDSNFIVEFYSREVEDELATRRRGRVVVNAVTYCRKYAVGDTKTVWDYPVTDEDKARFPRRWAAYQAGEENSVIGTPLEAWPLLNRDMRIALKNSGFKTVEQVASVTDGAMSTMPGNVGALIQKVKVHAQKFMDEQKEGEAERRLTERLEAKDSEIEAMKAQMAEMAQQMERLNEAKLSGPIPPSQSATPPQPQPAEPAPEAPGLEALDALPEVEPVDEAPKKRGPGRPRKTEAA